MPDAEIYMAKEDYMDYPFGPNAAVPVRRQQTARAGHPIIKRTPHMWIPVWIDYEVEQPKVQASRKTSSA